MHGPDGARSPERQTWPRHVTGERDRATADGTDAAARRRRRRARLGGGVKPAVSEGPGALVAEYGALREQPPSRERTRRLGEMLVGLLRESGTDATVRDEDPLVVVFRHDGSPYVMGVAWDGEAGKASSRWRCGSSRRARRLSCCPWPGSPGERRTGDRYGSGPDDLWDRTHAGSGRVRPGDAAGPARCEQAGRALRAAARTRRWPSCWPSPGGDAPARMMTPDRLPPPWPLPGTGYDGIPAELVLTAKTAGISRRASRRWMPAAWWS